MRLSNVCAGYVFLRPIHMLVVFSAPVFAAFLVRHAGSVWLRWSLVAVLALYVQVWFRAVPHLADVRDFNPAARRSHRGGSGRPRAAREQSPPGH